jgi:hypothetical protein
MVASRKASGNPECCPRSTTRSHPRTLPEKERWAGCERSSPRREELSTRGRRLPGLQIDTRMQAVFGGGPACVTGLAKAAKTPSARHAQDTIEVSIRSSARRPLYSCHSTFPIFDPLNGGAARASEIYAMMKLFSNTPGLVRVPRDSLKIYVMIRR